jgi:hypothetical protein
MVVAEPAPQSCEAGVEVLAPPQSSSQSRIRSWNHRHRTGSVVLVVLAAGGEGEWRSVVHVLKAVASQQAVGVGVVRSWVGTAREDRIGHVASAGAGCSSAGAVAAAAAAAVVA